MGAANLRGARLFQVDLQGANLHRVNLADTDLRKADLRNANLKDVNFTGAIRCNTQMPWGEDNSGCVE